MVKLRNEVCHFGRPGMPWSCPYERSHAAHLTRHTPNMTIDTSICKEESADRQADTVYVAIRAPSRSAVLPVLPVPRESLTSIHKYDR
jgi:hypothetical protein